MDETSSERAFDGEYELSIISGPLTSDKPCPSNLNLSVVVYGDDGKTGEIPLRESSNQEEEFLKANVVNQFKIDIPDIGKIYKIRLSYNEDCDWGPWFVEKIILTGFQQELIFPCNRFLSNHEDDYYETVREIAVEREDDQPLKTVLYHVTVYTGDRHGAETDAQTHIMLKGTRGDTGKRWLRHPVGDVIPFQRSGIDVFMIEAVDLGRITEIFIGHLGKGYGAGWYVEKVTIREGEFGSTEIVFPCHAWLDDHIGDCKTTRRLTPLGIISLDGQEEELKNLGTPSSKDEKTVTLWDITVCIDEVLTKDISRVHLTGVFYGSGGCKKTNIISLGEWSAGGRKTLKLQTDLTDIGDIYKLRVEMQDYDESVDVLLNSVSIQNVHTKEQFIFSFHRHLNTDTGFNCKELPALRVARNYAKVVRYIVDVTMSLQGSGDNGKLGVMLTGDAGDSGYRTITKGSSHKNGIPREGGFVFNIDAVDLGRLTSVSLSYSNEDNNKGDGWYVKYLTVKVEDSQNFNAGYLQKPSIYTAEVDVKFKADTLLSKVEKQIPLQEEIYDENVSYSSKSDQKQEINVKSSSQSVNDGVWELSLTYTTHPGDNENDIPQRLSSNNEQVQLFGSTNSSQVFTLSELEDLKVDSSNGSKTIVAKLPTGTSIGELYSMRLTCKHWNSSLKKVKLVANETEQTFLYYLSAPHHRKAENTPAIERDQIVSSLDIPLVRPDIPPLEHHRYIVTVKTGNQPSSDTDADVYIKIFGTSGDTGKRLLVKSTNKLNTFRKGTHDDFEIESTDIGEPRKVLVGHNGVGCGKGWFLEDVTITEFRDGRKSEYIFNNYKWLDDSVDDKLLERELYLTAARIQSDVHTKTTGKWKCRINSKEMTEADAVCSARFAFYLSHREQPITHSCQFEGNQSEFEINFPLHDGITDGFYKIRVEQILDEMDAHKSNEWPFTEFLMTDEDSGEKLRFIFDDSPIWQGSGRGVIRELPVARHNQPIDKVFDYYIVFCTSTESSPDTRHRNLSVQLRGSRGDTGWRKICNTQEATDSKLFQPNRVDMFSIEAVDLGNLESLSLRAKDGENMKWKIDKVKLKAGFYSEQEYVFLVDKWFGSADSEKIGSDVVEKVMLTETINVDMPNNNSMLSDGKTSYLVEADWEFVSIHDELSTSQSFSSANSQPMLMTKIYGSERSSDLMPFNVEDSIKTSRLHSEISIDPENVIGTITKIGVGIEEFSDTNKEFWMKRLQKITLLKLSVLNNSSKRYCSFRPTYMLFDNSKTNTKSSSNWLELVPEWPKLEASTEMVTFTVNFYTGDVDEAGTDADVYIKLWDGKNDCGKRWFFNDNKFVKGEMATFTFDAVKMDAMKQITVGHNGKNGTSGWYLDKLTITQSSEPKKNYVFICQKWLADLEDDSFIERKLDLHHEEVAESPNE